MRYTFTVLALAALSIASPVPDAAPAAAPSSFKIAGVISGGSGCPQGSIDIDYTDSRVLPICKFSSHTITLAYNFGLIKSFRLWQRLHRSCRTISCRRAIAQELPAQHPAAIYSRIPVRRLERRLYGLWRFRRRRKRPCQGKLLLLRVHEPGMYTAEPRLQSPHFLSLSKPRLPYCQSLPSLFDHSQTCMNRNFKY